MQVNGASASASSVLNEGLRGLQNAQKEILRSAEDIANANVRPAQGAEAASELAPEQQVNESQDITEPLINLRRQEQLFNASAQIVKTADETLGSLLDVKA